MRFKEQFKDFKNVPESFWKKNKLVKEVATAKMPLSTKLLEKIIPLALYGRYGRKGVTEAKLKKAVDDFVIYCGLADGVNTGLVEMNKYGFKISDRGIKVIEQKAGKK